MNVFAGWILSILGVAILGSVIDLVLPSGRMNKYIKSVFASVGVLILVLPLPNLFKNGCRTDYKLGDDILLQENYLQSVAEIKKQAIVKGLKESLQADGITLGEVNIEGDFSGSVPVIYEVKINLSQVVMDGQTEHINKYQPIAEKVSAALAIDKECVHFYG